MQEKKEASRVSARRAAVIAAGTVAGIAYGLYAVPEPVSWPKLAAIAGIGTLVGSLLAVAFIERKPEDAPLIGVVAILLILTTRALPYDQPEWLEAVRAVGIIVCALLMIRTLPRNGERRRSLLLTTMGVAIGLVTGLLVLALR